MSLRTHAQTCDRTAVCQRPRRTGRCSAQITPCPDGSSSGAGLGQESRLPGGLWQISRRRPAISDAATSSGFAHACTDNRDACRRQETSKIGCLFIPIDAASPVAARASLQCTDPGRKNACKDLRGDLKRLVGAKKKALAVRTAGWKAFCARDVAAANPGKRQKFESALREMKAGRAPNSSPGCAGVLGNALVVTTHAHVSHRPPTEAKTLRAPRETAMFVL